MNKEKVVNLINEQHYQGRKPTKQNTNSSEGFRMKKAGSLHLGIPAYSTMERFF
ncbi:MAG TPA: hypothetical protein VK072_03340 [Candidatus Avamphibacillus sp.]|nr:hypothetical protein [Candidatus Avamphibacillus sp.]